MSHEKALEAAARARAKQESLGKCRTLDEQVDYERRTWPRILSSKELEPVIDAYLSAIVPDEVAGLVERLRLRAKTLNTGAFVSPDDISTMGYYSRGSAKLDTDAASLLTALAARAEKAEREAEAWERRAGEAIMGEAAAVERATTLESELSALRARLEEAGKVIVGLLPESPRDIVNGTRPSFEQCEDARRFLEEAK